MLGWGVGGVRAVVSSFDGLSPWLFAIFTDLCFQKKKGLSNKKDGSGDVAAFLK